MSTTAAPRSPVRAAGAGGALAAAAGVPLGRPRSLREENALLGELVAELRARYDEAREALLAARQGGGQEAELRRLAASLHGRLEKEAAGRRRAEGEAAALGGRLAAAQDELRALRRRLAEAEGRPDAAEALNRLALCRSERAEAAREAAALRERLRRQKEAHADALQEAWQRAQRERHLEARLAELRLRVRHAPEVPPVRGLAVPAAWAEEEEEEEEDEEEEAPQEPRRRPSHIDTLLGVPGGAPPRRPPGRAPRRQQKRRQHRHQYHAAAAAGEAARLRACLEDAHRAEDESRERYVSLLQRHTQVLQQTEAALRMNGH